MAGYVRIGHIGQAFDDHHLMLGQQRPTQMNGAVRQRAHPTVNQFRQIAGKHLLTSLLTYLLPEKVAIGAKAASFAPQATPVSTINLVPGFSWWLQPHAVRRHGGIAPVIPGDTLLGHAQPRQGDNGMFNMIGEMPVKLYVVSLII
ncbi:hypothetical protein D3C81_964770 [compost metagenome]